MEAARRATIDDLGAVLELAAELREELVPMRGGSLWSRTAAYPEPLEATFRALLDREDVCLVVGTIDDVIVGFGACSIAVQLDLARNHVDAAMGVDVPWETPARRARNRCVGVGGDPDRRVRPL